MKKLLTAILPLVAVINAYSQNVITAKINHQKDLVTKTETGCKAEFILMASESQMQDMHSEAVKYSSYMTFTTVNHSLNGTPNPSYECTLEFTYAVPVEYIHKMYVTFGVEKFEYDGKTYPVNDLMTIVKK